MKRDYLKGNHSFKTWFRIMWNNRYIQLFLVGFFLLIMQLTHIKWCVDLIAEQPGFGIIMTGLGMLIPIGIVSAVSYFGFYKHWKFLTGK